MNFFNTVPSLVFSFFASVFLFSVFCGFLWRVCLCDMQVHSHAFVRRYLFRIGGVILLLYGGYLAVAWSSVSPEVYFYNYVDQFHFWEKCEELAQYPSIGRIFEDCFVRRIHIEQEAIYFWFGTLGCIANKFLGGNNVYFQMYWVSFFAVLLNITVARLALLFTDSKTAFKWTLIFSGCSFLLGYSPWLLRDVHIAFLFTLGLLLLFRGGTLWGIGLQFIIVIVLYQLRYESCFLYLPVLGYYVWFWGRGASSRVIIRVCAVLGGMCAFAGSIGFLISFLETILSTGTSYNEWTVEMASEGGLARYIYMLPPGIRHFFVVVYSQMTPFPFWTTLWACRTPSQFILEGVDAISPIVWPYIAFFTVYRVCSLQRLKSSPVIVKFLIVYSALFLIANSSNIHFRRLLCVTPIIFLLFLYFRERSSPGERSRFLGMFSFCYLCGCVLYVLFKGGFF